jgi:hypothetical protein
MASSDLIGPFQRASIFSEIAIDSGRHRFGLAECQSDRHSPKSQTETPSEPSAEGATEICICLHIARNRTCGAQFFYRTPPEARFACQDDSPEQRMRRLVSIGIVGMAAFCVGVATNGAAAAEKEKKPGKAITVLEATYGGNCSGIAKGNVTEFVRSKCNDTNLCNYRVYYKSMGGDPAEGCEKNFSVTYNCGRRSKHETCTLAAEAGMGGEEGHPNQFCLLHCVKTMGQSGSGSSARRQASRPSAARSEQQAVTSTDGRGTAPPSQGLGARPVTGNPW